MMSHPAPSQRQWINGVAARTTPTSTSQRRSRGLLFHRRRSTIGNSWRATCSSPWCSSNCTKRSGLLDWCHVEFRSEVMEGTGQDRTCLWATTVHQVMLLVVVN